VNDEKLKPANENPWYCLATLHGEQPPDSFDQHLAQNNQQAWQRWFAGLMPANELRSLFFARTKKSELPPQQTERIDFTFTLFDRPVSFQSFAFQSEVDFSSSKFCCDVNFCEAQFTCYSDFQSVRFLGNADFDRTQFNGSKIDLGYTEFSGKAYFRSARLVNSNFTAARFRGDGYFEHATFDDKANFIRVIFSGFALFDDAVFNGYADFAQATFAWTSFRSVTFSSGVMFRDTTFPDFIYFINAKFGSEANFARARFEASVPDFRGATMHEATEWHDVVWPEPPSKKHQAQDQVYAFERLKQEMERLNKHEDEQSFFRKELRARRGLVPVLSGTWLLNVAYQVSSNYGVSVARPISLLVAVYAIGVYVFSGAPLTPAAVYPEAIPHAAAISFANILPMVPITHDIASAAHSGVGMTRMGKVVGIVQTLLSLPLLFLFGLAIRNRFRMK
jgi:uncharacterized protein YjbI with pentapeptide repeats